MDKISPILEYRSGFFVANLDAKQFCASCVPPLAHYLPLQCKYS